MTQHYFIGIHVPEKEALTLDQMKSLMELHKTHKVLPALEDMHITLLYIGAIEKELLFQLIKSIDQIEYDYKIIQLTSNEVRLFGNSDKPRVVYANIEENHLLKRLHRELNRIVKSLSITFDKKPYVPHITLAKKWNGYDQICSISSFTAPIKFEVNQFSIYEIHPNQLPKYKPIATFRLGDA